MFTPDAIKLFRKSKGWSQEELARRLGIDQATVSRIERGAAEPSRPVRQLLELLLADWSAAPEETAA